MLADYYMLAPVTTALHDWFAYQFHDPATDSGFALFFRRPDSQSPTFEANYVGLTPTGRYSMSFCEGYNCSGRGGYRALANLPVTLPTAPGCVLVEYKNHRVGRTSKSATVKVVGLGSPIYAEYGRRGTSPRPAVGAAREPTGSDYKRPV